MKDIANHIHFIGIGGIGMSGLARILLGFGVKCSGSDLSDSNVVKGLREIGAEIYIGHSKENIQDDVDLVVYSSAIKASNEELKYAYEKGIKVIGRAELLSQIMARKKSIAVAGAHGKTTTTGMIATMLKYNKMEPTVVVGGILPYIGSNSCWGNGDYLVAEADESDGSFLLLNPYGAVITNIENDHLDHYGSMENLVNAFREFVGEVPAEGFVSLGVDCPVNQEIASENQGDARFTTFSIHNDLGEWQGRNIKFSGYGSTFDVYYKGEFMANMGLNVPGEYNVANALGAISVGHHLGLTMEQIKEGLLEFSGTGRRFEKLKYLEDRNILVVDDYAHHPTEIASVLKGGKNLDFKRVIAVFQPHRYSRTQMLAEEFGKAFNDADIVILDSIYAAFETPIDGVSSNLIVEALKRNGKENVYYGKDKEEVLALLDQIVEDDDLVMILGAGNIRKTGEEYASLLK